MQCKEIEAVLENEGLSPLPEAVRAHAASCSACSNLIADFSAIISVAETLPAEVEPPTRVWVALRNQLEAEGIIRAGAAVRVAEPASWIENLSSLLRGRRDSRSRRRARRSEEHTSELQSPCNLVCSLLL